MTDAPFPATHQRRLEVLSNLLNDPRVEVYISGEDAKIDAEAIRAALAEIARLTAQLAEMPPPRQPLKLQRHSYDENGICRCGASRYYATTLSDDCPLVTP